MTRVVLDSNVFISAVIFGGKPRQVIHLAGRGFIEVYTSGPLRGEVERLLATKFGWARRRVVTTAGYLWSVTRWLEPTCQLTNCTDPDDNRVLECAVEARAEWIVTGDRHLLLLDPFREIRIVTVRDFLASFQL